MVGIRPPSRNHQADAPAHGFGNRQRRAHATIIIINLTRDGTNISHPVLGKQWTLDAGRQSNNQLPGLPNLPQAANSECVKWQPRS